MKKSLKNVLALAFMVIVSTSTTYAAGYGYGQPSDTGDMLLIDKLVGRPKDNKGAITYEFVDNLGRGDFKFSPGSYVFFKLHVKNNGTKTLRSITVKDVFPSNLEVFEDVGTFDAASRTITVSVDTLAPGESRDIMLKARVLSEDKLPASEGVFCLVNNAEATTASEKDTDASQFCIEKQVLGIQEVPATGADGGLLTLAFTSAMGALGLRIRRKAS